MADRALPAWLAVLFAGVFAAESLAAKDGSAFFPEPLVARVKANIARYPWAATIRDQIVKAAEPWLKMSDDELWNLQFGHTIKRSWMVWSNGFCPACKKGVPMYNWEIDALARPWKVRCPHCKELFPKNDFLKFHQSGLDEHRIFDPARADRSLLFNVDHPDKNDPLHMFGVDDGEGYVEGGNRWRFIGAYLIYGQWKQAIVGGMRRLADAYVLTGDPRYAHKAGILLDRAADVYPTFDYKTEGLVYEVSGVAGYVSTWHDACAETRELVLAYDMILGGIREDAELQRFLAAKAKQYKLDNPKASFADIRRNVEDRILVDCQTSRPKINSNYPQTDVTIAFAKTALAWPDNRDEVNAIIAGIVDKTTAVDGTSGEKGMAGYSSYAINGLANLLAMYARMDPAFLPDMFERSPRLHDAFRFHMDTWCLQNYYPSCGDSGSYCSPVSTWASIPWTGEASLVPSMYSFVWQVYERTNDESFVQGMCLQNGSKLDGLPHDLFAADPQAFRQSVKEVIDRTGTRIKLPSVNKQQWHIGLLRGGQDENERVLWLNYDSGGQHSHANGMNLGLFAKGLDLMPDFGYPPVQYGGWGAPRARWYVSTMAHNTVVVDGANTRNAGGTTTLWADGRQFHAIRASCPALIGGTQYERMAAMIDLSDKDFYVVDVFRVAGGKEHARFARSHFGTIATQGVPSEPAALYADVQHMRNWHGGPAKPGWSVDWKIEDRYKLLDKPADLHVRHTDLTTDAQAYTGETWVSTVKHGFTGNDEAWVPHFAVRRTADIAPLTSTFVSVVEPYEGTSKIAQIRRVAASSDADVVLEVVLADGRRDLFVSRQVENNPAASQPAEFAEVKLDGQACFCRRDSKGEPVMVALGKSHSLTAGDVSVRLKDNPEYVEIVFSEGAARITAGDAGEVVEVLKAGRRIEVQRGK
jgi:hypothetical protein